MIIRIKEFELLDNYVLLVTFDDGKVLYYDMNDDIDQIPNYCDLKNIYGLWKTAKLDSSRSWICWNEYIDIPGDVIYRYGKPTLDS